MINKKKVYNIMYITICTLIVAVVIQSIGYKEPIYSFSKSIDLSKSWQMTIDGSDIKQVIDLPYHSLDNKEENSIIIQKKLPNKNVNSPHIRIGSSQQSFKVYVNNKKIYDFDSMRGVNNGKTGGSVWKIIKLPEDCFGKYIRIEFKSSYKRISGNLSRIKFGTKDQLVAELFKETIYDKIISFTLIILSIFILYLELEKIKNKIKTNNFYLISIILSISIWISSESQFYVFEHNNYVFNYYVQFITLFIFPLILYKYLLLEYNFESDKLIGVLYNIHLCLLLILMLGQITGIVTFFEGQWLFLTIFSATFLVILVLIFIKSKNDIKIKRLGYILRIIFICLLLDNLFYFIKGSKINFDFINVGIIIIEFIVAKSMYKDMLQLRKNKEKNDYLELQLEYQLRHYSYIEQENMNLKRYRHDMANHWNLINMLIKSNKIEEANRYSNKMTSNLIDFEKLVFDTGNPILDAIITEKIQIAKGLGIKVKTDIMIIKNIDVDPIDFCIIFGNILDNAIEACCKLNDKRYIDIKLNSKSNMFLCKIKNSINPNVSINKDYKTTKDNPHMHGFGLINIKSTIEKYNGYMEINNTNDYYEISFILYDV